MDIVNTVNIIISDKLFHINKEYWNKISEIFTIFNLSMVAHVKQFRITTLLKVVWNKNLKKKNNNENGIKCGVIIKSTGRGDTKIWQFWMKNKGKQDNSSGQNNTQ